MTVQSQIIESRDAIIRRMEEADRRKAARIDAVCRLGYLDNQDFSKPTFGTLDWTPAQRRASYIDFLLQMPDVDRKVAGMIDRELAA